MPDLTGPKKVILNCKFDLTGLELHKVSFSSAFTVEIADAVIYRGHAWSSTRIVGVSFIATVVYPEHTP